jgi:hypothetical protein
MVKVFKNSRFEGLENKGKLLGLYNYRESSLNFNSSSTIQLKNTYSIMGNSTSQPDNLQLTQENTLQRNNLQPTQNDTLVEFSPSRILGYFVDLLFGQPDNYNLTWGRLPREVFIFVVSHLNLKCDIMPLLCVCKKMIIRAIRELCYVTGYYPNVNLWIHSCPRIKLTSTRFYSYPLWISYTSSSLWRIVKNSCPIHCLIINLKYKVVSSEPLSTRWDLSNLDSLVINMSKRFDQDEQVSVYDGESETDNLPPLENLFDQYQLPSLKQMVLLNMYITPKTWNHLSPNLEFIQLVNCQLELPWNINLRKFKYLEEFTIDLRPMGDASCESCLDLKKCTMEFPGMSRPLKFKDDSMFKVL